MPTGGHENCPHAANRSAHLGFGGVGRAGCARLVHRGDSFPGEGLGEPDRVARGLTDVRVVEETVDGRGREGFGHELVKARRVEVRGHRDGPFLVGGVDEPVEPLSRVRTHFEQANIVDHN